MNEKFKKELDIELHNEIRWLIEDYIGEFSLKRELIDKIIEKVKESFKWQLKRKNFLIKKALNRLKDSNKFLLHYQIELYEKNKKVINTIDKYMENKQ